jgi:hypothetical protein
VGGWGQCLAEMVAVQRLNEDLEQRVFGVVSNGKTWERGQLDRATFIQNIKPYNLSDLTSLFGALHDVFERCRQQVVSMVLAQG